ncbi:MAG: DUF1207 domain-containing protein [Pirellulales bacterium]|nr:DUF1207 domain-containing protein [Pirellulales bacterium]
MFATRTLLLIVACAGIAAAANASPPPDALNVAAGELTVEEPLVIDGDAYRVPGYGEPQQHFWPGPYFPQGFAGPTPAVRSPWQWTLLPDGLLYRSYLAGPNEPRFGGVFQHTEGVGNFWDITLGGRAGIVRYGNNSLEAPEGWQLDIEGAALPRLDLTSERDLQSVDFRFGVPITYAVGAYQAKVAYYHLSSHLGDELLEDDPTLVRDNYSRDVLVLGQGYFLTPDVRLYGEVGYAFYTSGTAEAWETQFGAEFSPAWPTGIAGAPFAAVNGYLHQELDWGGSFVAQVGWQWRGDYNRHLFRLGFQYFYGHSNQFQFLTRIEQQYGFGIWYDY